MKKSAAMIYRFIFIFFSIWGLFLELGFYVLNMSPKILNLTFLCDVLSFLCILAVFVTSISHRPGKMLRAFKYMLTLCSAVLLIINFRSVFGIFNNAWILKFLLPAMMVVDWLLFDKKGEFSFTELLAVLAGAILLAFLLAVILNKLFGVENFLELMGLPTDFNGILKLLGMLGGLGLLMYLLDFLTNSFGKKNFKSQFAFFYRLAFLALEAYALIVSMGYKMIDFLYALRSYHILINFFCFICISVVLIYSLIKYKSLKRNSTPFPRLKAGLSVCVMVVTAAFLIYSDNTIYTLSELILIYICPIMMFLDWLMFDYKGDLKIYDPFLWVLIPVIYFAVANTYFMPINGAVHNKVFALSQPEMFLGFFASISAGGYIVYIIDKLFALKK